MINGRVCETFKEACVELHLVQDDQEWTHCFREACLFSSGSSLRNLFVVALTFGQLLNSALLWTEHCNSICDDLSYKLQQLFPDDDTYVLENHELFHQGSPALDYGLYLIEKKLTDQGHSLQQYRMPKVEYNWSLAFSAATTPIPSNNTLIAEQLNYTQSVERNLYLSRYQQFNNDQKQAFDTIIHHLQSNYTHLNKCFFLHGPAGTGKTFVYNTIANYIRSKKEIVLCVASSGIAALLLKGGRTSHSRFKIPLSLDAASTCYIPRGTYLAELLKSTKLIIWDEVPMQHRYCFEAVNRTLQDIRENDTLFGGVPVILGGDFAQIAPVIKHGDRADIVGASIQQSDIWDYTQVIHLRTNMRIRGNSANNTHFKEWLHQIIYTKELHNIDIPLPHYIYTATSISDLIDKVYPLALLNNTFNNTAIMYRSAILTSKNIVVDEINESILNIMTGHQTTHISADEAEYSESEYNEIYQVTTEYLQTLNPPNFPPSKLSLKVGCVVMLLRNLDPKAGLCNGTRLIVKEIGQYVLKVAVLKEVEDGGEQIALIPRITLVTTNDEYPFTLKRTQFPVRLSFAMTINKSQGQSLESVGIDLRHSVFTHGQLYVALSRSTKVEKIYVLHSEENTNNTVDNIIYPELLL